MPALLLEVSNLPVPLIWSSPLYSSRDCSLEQSSAAVSPLRRGLRPLVALRQREGHGRVRQITHIAPRPVPSNGSPAVASLHVSGELFPRDQAAPPHLGSVPSR
jgi:hypothetical protein